MTGLINSRSTSNIYIYIYILTNSLISLTLASFLVLTSSSTSADDSIISNVSVTVPVSCNMSSDTSLDTPHTATINNGTYQEDIGTTTFQVFCNDNNGFSVYAIGYSDNEFGNTKMLATVGGSLSPSNDIVTGTNIAGDTSNWAMKLIKVDGAYEPTILSAPNIAGGADVSFSDYHTVPEEYTKVATLSSNTDFTIGSAFQTTYRAYISPTQLAGSYQGKVRYTLVHPNDARAPRDPRKVAYLDTGRSVNAKMKNVANNTTDAKFDDVDTKIKAVAKADTIPAGFSSSSMNTISTTDSPDSAYIFFDDATGTMYYYTEYDDIILNDDSSYMFYNFSSLADIDALASWDASATMDMSFMFSSTSALSDIDALASWDTSAVTSLFGIFHKASSLSDISALGSWDTSSVTNMSNLFSYASSNITSLDALASWNTSAVTNMHGAFYNLSLTDISALRFWNVSSVTDMSNLFSYATAITDVSALSAWDTSSVTNMFAIFYNSDNIDATVLNDWDISSVTNMEEAFTCPTNKRPIWYQE